MLSDKHWTERSIEDFRYRIICDFLAQIGIPEERGDLSLGLIGLIRLARASGCKLAVVLYDDDDPLNRNGPVNSAIFYECWKRCGMPKDFFELREIRDKSATEGESEGEAAVKY